MVLWRKSLKDKEWHLFEREVGKDVPEEGVSKLRSEQGRLAESVQVKVIPGTNPEAEGNKKAKVSATDTQGRDSCY